MSAGPEERPQGNTVAPSPGHGAADAGQRPALPESQGGSCRPLAGNARPQSRSRPVRGAQVLGALHLDQARGGALEGALQALAGVQLDR